ncbi:uncharacterized protein LOC127848814 [Dreissena polymorpha]|uniref:C1q domain-containing protein n=1 Tax=Dreissena polymorpha TaxID=45954 RepID=A0A9D4DU40_DREPO|nr:uncharacterized protein LOC127848814 [Dreissena polymorpha]KAH3755699.1 hypothetical protein DPMN_190397 [Dreissena polymorpha]
MNKFTRALFYALNITVAAFAREPSCPVCSRYDYEERILERVLTNELDMKNMVKEIRETNAKVEAALNVFQEDKTELATAMIKLTKTQDEMKLKLDDAINGALLNISKAVAEMTTNTSGAITLVQKENKILKDQLVVPVIYFYARTPAQLTMTPGHDVIFTSVNVNEGQGYNPSNGRFTVSVAGLYVFTVQHCIQYVKYSDLEIVHQGKTLQRAVYQDGDSLNSCSAMQAFTMATMADQIWVKTTGACFFFEDSIRYTSFSGALIHT